LISGLAGLLGTQGIDLKEKIAQTTQVLVADFVKQGVKNAFHQQSPEIQKANQKIQAQQSKFRNCKDNNI
jgi:hypothetical protein